MPLRMFATVGTTTYPFTRFSNVVAEFAKNVELQITYQFGFSSIVNASNVRALRFLDSVEYSDELSAADIVVSHAGIGSFIDMRQLQKPYLIIPRSSLLGEHVDDHQIELSELVRSSYGAQILLPGDELPLYSHIRPMKSSKTSNSTSEFIGFIQNWLDS